MAEGSQLFSQFKDDYFCLLWSCALSVIAARLATSVRMIPVFMWSSVHCLCSSYVLCIVLCCLFLDTELRLGRYSDGDRYVSRRMPENDLECSLSLSVSVAPPPPLPPLPPPPPAAIGTLS